MSLRHSCRLLACGVALVALVGCDEGAGAAYADPEKDPDLPDVTIPKDELDEWEVYDFGELVEPFDTEAECIAYQESEHDDTSAMTQCRCNKCLEVMQECDALQGCVEIRECAQKSGCTSEFDCYLVPFIAPCTDVIDEWGNAGVATATATELMDCSTANDCN